MADKELRRMSRPELIEIIYALKSNEESLQKQNENLRMKLNDRTLRMEKAGSIAEAALQLNDVFSVAQAAADDYLASVKAANEDMEEKKQTAAIEAERVVSEAQAQAEQVIGDANQEAARIITMAREQADSTLMEAKKNAEATKTEAENYAKTCVENAEKKSGEIIAVAEQKRNELEIACREKSEETQKELEARWDAFENRVEDVLSQHRELSMLLKDVTAKPAMVVEPIDAAISQEVLTKETVSETQIMEGE